MTSMTTMTTTKEFLIARITYAALVIVALAVVTVPPAAHAVETRDDNVRVAGEPTPGSTLTVSLTDGSFHADEQVEFTTSGEGAPTYSVVKADTVSSTRTASHAGAASVYVTLPFNAIGSYTVTGRGLSSGATGTATIAVPGTDLGSTIIAGGPTSTSQDSTVLVTWGVAGLLVFAAAFVAVMGIVRRQRATAINQRREQNL